MAVRDRRGSLCLGLALVLGCSTTPRASRATEAGPTPLDEPVRVLLIGDSISIGYTEAVGRVLGDRAVVEHARKPDGVKVENCAGTSHGVLHLDRWLAQSGGGWDVVVFNFGLHDLKRVHPETGKNSNDPSDPQQAAPELYELQLRRIVERLEQSNARLVFATTTPVPDGVRPYRAPEDPVEYNAIAERIMEERGIVVLDLYAFAAPRLDELQNPLDVHFTATGSAALGARVADGVLEAAGLCRPRAR